MKADSPALLASAPLTTYLHPGQLFVSDQPYTVTTILGSCVSVCLWDEASGAGAVCHYLLPGGIGSDRVLPRFGNAVIPALIERLRALGVVTGDLRAKVFGGACVLDAMVERTSHLGTQNVQVAYRLLDQANIPVVGGDVGGRRGRKLVFRIADGAAWIKLL